MKKFICASALVLLSIFGLQSESKGQVGFSITVGGPGYYYYDNYNPYPYYRSYYYGGYYRPYGYYRRAYWGYDRPRYRYWRDDNYRRYNRRHYRHHHNDD